MTYIPYVQGHDQSEAIRRIMHDGLHSHDHLHVPIKSLDGYEAAPGLTGHAQNQYISFLPNLFQERTREGGNLFIIHS